MSMISLSSIITAIALGGLLLASGMSKMLLFALFWIGLLSLLITLLNKERWTNKEWIGYAAFATSTITGVLIAANIIRDIVTLSVVVIGLLVVTALVDAVPQHQRRVKKPLFVSVENSKKYHRRGCTLIMNKNTARTFATKEQAELAGFTPCKRCN